MNANPPPFDDPPETDEARFEWTIDDSIAAVAQLGATLAVAEPGDPALNGTLDDPSTIDAWAATRMAMRSQACPLDRKGRARDADHIGGKGLDHFRTPKAVAAYNRKIEARIKDKRREERDAKREGREERYDAVVADGFIEGHEIFALKRDGSVHLYVDGEWRAAELALGPAIDRYLKSIAISDEDRAELLTSKKREAIERTVKKSSALEIRDVEFDGKRWLKGLPGRKVADLKAGAIRPMRSDDTVTMRTAVSPDATMKTPTWERFLLQTSCGDGAWIKAVKRALGYSISGETSLRKAFICDGHGQNGKSTLCRVVRTILGDYGYASSARIVASGYSGHDTVFAALENKRLVEIPETDHTLVLGERFKILTGNDTIAGRGMRENERPISIRCKLWICANNNIKFDATSKSFADRLCVIPFRNAVEKPDPTLFDRLIAEGPGILAELLREAKAFHDDPRLLACEAIEKATAAYVGEADRYAEWLNANYHAIDEETLNADARRAISDARTFDNVPDSCLNLGTPLKVMFDSWRTFAVSEGDYVGNSKLLATALRERGFIVKFQRTSRTAFVVGLWPGHGRVEAEADEKGSARHGLATSDEKDVENPWV